MGELMHEEVEEYMLSLQAECEDLIEYGWIKLKEN